MVQIKAYVNVMDSEDPPLSLSFLDLEESYNAGWKGAALLATSSENAYNLSTTLSLAVTAGIGPAAPVAFMLALSGGAPTTTIGGERDDPTTITKLLPGALLRVWPSVVIAATPQRSNSETVGTALHLTFSDTISYLGSRPIWGAYRNSSLAEIVGGAISLAVGGDGQPTLNPITPGLPSITIVDELRESLGLIPYAVAAGNTLSGWLGDLQRLIGIRMEMRINASGVVQLILTDQPVNHRIGDVPSGFLPVDGIADNNVIPLSLDPDDETLADSNITELSIVAAQIIRIANKPTGKNRGIVLDDPLHGSFRRLGSAGSVGSVVTATGISADEAVRRATSSLYGRYLESLIVEVETRQTGIRPGRSVNFGESYLNIEYWQIILVRHVVNGTEYRNRATICSSQYAWLPSSAFEKYSPVYVTAVVDGGEEYDEGDPVPRDRLGRIPITFSFLPRPIGDEGEALKIGDTDGDGRINLDDYDQETLDDYESRSEYWDGEVEKYHSGALDDPYGDRDDEDLTKEELKGRNDIKTKREATLRYLIAKKRLDKDERDRDQDGVISSRDEAITTELETLLREPGSRNRIEEQLIARERDDEEEDETDPEDRIPENLLNEYKALFAAYRGEGDDPNLAVKRDAAIAHGRWPPRIPVTAVETMAGGLHGLISAHRQGDICRIAVHSPLSIELVGYQYRSDRQINDSLVGAATGMVVDHNSGEAWSGFVFRSTASLEGEDS